MHIIEQPSVRISTTQLVASLNSQITIVKRSSDDAVLANLLILRHLCRIAFRNEFFAQFIGFFNIVGRTAHDIECLESATVHQSEAFLTVILYIFGDI